jgi:hypothetical protein
MLMGQIIKKEIIKDLPMEAIIEGNRFKELKGDFEFRPFSLSPSKNFLKILGNENIYSNFSLKPTFIREYGEISYDFKEGKMKIPNVSFNSYCEINFWKNVHPILEKTREKIKEIAKNENLTSLDKEKEIMKIKEEFHEKYFQKRIEVMRNLENYELLIETEKAYEKYKNYKERGEK